MKDRPQSYRGRVKDDWLDFFWQKIAPDHFPALVRKNQLRKRSSHGVGWDGLDIEFSDGTNLHMRFEAVIRVRATLWKWKNGEKRRLRIYYPAMIWWAGDHKRVCRPDRFFDKKKKPKR